MSNAAAYCLQRSASRFGNKTALLVVTDRQGTVEERWRFSEIERNVLSVAGGLAARGLKRGDRVLLRLGNTSDFPLVYFGAIAAGYVPVPTSAMLTGPECDFLVSDCRPAAIVHDGRTTLPDHTGGALLLGPDDVAALKAGDTVSYADVGADDPAYLVYTSGTSGTPKGVLHAHRAVPGRAPMYRDWYGITPDDVLLHAGAFNWTYTLGAGLMDPWANGATSIVYDGPRDPDLWGPLIRVTGASLFAAVPSLYRRILKYSEPGPLDLGNLRHGLVAGEALRSDLHREWCDRTGLGLYEALGMSEISTYISSAPTVPTRPGSPGRAQAGRQIAILAETGGTEPLAAGKTGALAVHWSDPGLMLGYWNDQETTAAAFRGDWFVTGDRARIDEDGYVWHEGRLDDVMNAFGYRVAPDEIERVLAEHPTVSEAAVTDIEVRDGIRLITAFIVPVEDNRAEPDRLAEWCAGRLAEYKRPKHYVMLDTLPRTASGKIMRRSLALP